MSQPATSVILDDPGDLGGAGDAALVAGLQVALGTWAQHLEGSGTLTVALDVEALGSTDELAAGGPTLALADGTRIMLPGVDASGAAALLA